MKALLIDLEETSEEAAQKMISDRWDEIDGIILVRLEEVEFSEGFSKFLMENAENGVGTLFIAYKKSGGEASSARAEDNTSVQEFVRDFEVTLI